MSLMFKLLIAVVALALLVAGGLLARHFRGRRLPPAPLPDGETEAEPAKPTRPRLGRKAVEPDPEPEAPPVPRRRQLHSFAEAERGAVEPDEAPEPLPVAEPAEPAAASPPSPEPEPEPMIEEPEAAPEPDYAQAVLDRLEDAFEALQDGSITLDAYRDRVLLEQDAVEQRIVVHQADIESDELDAALAARESVRWCLDWADEQARP